MFRRISAALATIFLMYSGGASEALTYHPTLISGGAENQLRCGPVSRNGMAGGFELEGDGQFHQVTYRLTGGCGGNSSFRGIAVFDEFSQFANLQVDIVDTSGASIGSQRWGFSAKNDEATLIFGSPGNRMFDLVFSFTDNGQATPGNLGFRVSGVPLPGTLPFLAVSMLGLGVLNARKRKASA